MMKPTLVVLAAGMGSRYGGLKQVDPVGPSGEAILDYSVFDAIRGGFGKVVFVIRRDVEAEFKEKIGKKYEGLIPVGYCYQDLNDLPAPYALPEGRTKPWGTAHAVRSARTVVKEPFAVINADDFYGRDAFAKLGAFLGSLGSDSVDQGLSSKDSGSLGSDSVDQGLSSKDSLADSKGPNADAKGPNADSKGPNADAKGPNADAKGPYLHFAMAAYRLDLTLSENGSVARGICDISDEGHLTGVTEMTKLVKAGEVAENRENPDAPVKVPLDARVSMNCWGFTPQLFAELEERFVKFLAARGTEMKSEWYIPFVVDELIKEGKADCTVLPTDSSWFGVTYREDKPYVVSEIRKLVDAGEYPSNLLKR